MTKQPGQRAGGIRKGHRPPFRMYSRHCCPHMNLHSILAACHTAEVDGYVLEGHVPAAAVRRLLEKRPTAIGLAVPGMPAGSPGMESGVPQRYDVVLFGANGRQPFMHFVGAENLG